MGTLAHSGNASTHTKEVAVHHTANTIWERAEAAKFGIIPLLFLIVPCLAGIAASSCLSIDNMTLFVVAGAPAMVVETLILGMASMRSVIISSAISSVISLAIIAFTYLV